MMGEEGDMVQVTSHQRLENLAAQPLEESHPAEHAKAARLLLFVHAAAHDEAMEAIRLAAADFNVEVYPR